jgi:hypothetical protein
MEDGRQEMGDGRWETEVGRSKFLNLFFVLWIIFLERKAFSSIPNLD